MFFAFLIGLCVLVIYINSPYYRDDSVNVYDSFVSDHRMGSDEHLVLTDENHYELNSQIKSQQVQALEHDAHISSCTFDQLYFINWQSL